MYIVESRKRKSTDFEVLNDNAQSHINNQIVEKLDEISKFVKTVGRILVEDSRPRASSGQPERDHHQQTMKQEARILYKAAARGVQNTRCMILGLEFPNDKIVCSHIIGVRNQNALTRLGLSYQQLWNPRNAILLYHELEKKI